MTTWKPTAKQRAVLEAASECGTERSISAICSAARVRRSTFYDWMNEQPQFREAWEQVWYGSIRRHLPSVVAAMIARAQKGDVQAARLVVDMAGVIKQQHHHTVDMTVRHEAEKIASKYGLDPERLIERAQELETLQ